jgi:hypothetical protein
MRRMRWFVAIGLLWAAGALFSPARAGVVVLANQTEGKVAFVSIQADGQQTRRSLDRGEVTPLPTATAVDVVFDDGKQSRRRTLRANAIYCFQTDGHKIDLLPHPIPGVPAGDSPACTHDPLYTIPVKILVDDKEPTAQRVWEKRYRQRLAEASAIIERHCRVRFEVVAVGTWASDSSANDLQKLMEDFERKVKPAPARLAIGFTGQHETLEGETHMGGARGPFRPHILIREWGRQVAGSERLEILTHELAHLLGAVHSPESLSVMRPDISDRQSRARSFRIAFDAPNTLVMYLVGEELCRRPLVHLGQLPSATKDQLRAAYTWLAAELPSDPAAPRYLGMLDQSLGLAGESPARLEDAIIGARSVVRAVTAAAQKNHRLLGTGEQAKKDGDALTEHYVRHAAAAARQLPREVATQAFLLGIGVGLDDSKLVPNTPLLGDICQRLESESDRAARLEVLGTPTMRGRHDLAQHFAISAALVVLIGPQGAEGAGIVKELSDSRGQSGFSFVDLSADLSGILFAGAVRDGAVPLSRLEDGFAVADFLPGADGLAEGIGWDDFVHRYGNPPDTRLFQQREAIRRRILALAGYKDHRP